MVGFTAAACCSGLPASKMLAVTVSGLDCAHGPRGSQPAAAAQALTCMLHGCSTAADAGAACQLQLIHHMSFDPCAGAVLVSTDELLQHLHQTHDVPAGRPDTAGNDAGPASTSWTATAEGAQEHRTSLAASCSPRPGVLSSTDTSSSTASVWTDTFHLPLSEGDRPPAEPGTLNITQPLLLEVNPTPNLSAQPLPDGWSAGDLILVDLALPAAALQAAAKDPQLFGSPSQQLNSSSAEQQLPHDGLAAAACTAGWSLWLARAGMVVFVGGLQLLPLSQFLRV